MPDLVDQSYRLDRPTRATTYARLEQLIGSRAAAEAWESACRSVGIPSDRELSVEELKTLAMRLRQETTPLAILGTSLLIWLRCYESTRATNENALRA